MENVLIARKDWSNAAAFIEVNPENGEVRVRGKFYMDCRGYPGPTTGCLGIIPNELADEAKALGWRDQKSQELAKFCEFIWEKAKKVEPWFGY